jgi:hypothetical protein
MISNGLPPVLVPANTLGMASSRLRPPARRGEFLSAGRGQRSGYQPGSPYLPATAATLPAGLGLRYLLTYPYTPKTDRKIERLDAGLGLYAVP